MWCRQLPDRHRHIRLRPDLRDDLLDLTLALEPHRREQLAMIARRQVRGEKADEGQVQRTVRERIEYRREAACRTGRLDASVRRVFGQMEHTRAVGEERRAALGQIEPPRVELGQCGDQLGGRVALARRELTNAREEFRVGRLIPPVRDERRSEVNPARLRERFDEADCTRSLDLGKAVKTFRI